MGHTPSHSWYGSGQNFANVSSFDPSTIVYGRHQCVHKLTSWVSSFWVFIEQDYKDPPLKLANFSPYVYIVLTLRFLSLHQSMHRAPEPSFSAHVSVYESFLHSLTAPRQVSKSQTRCETGRCRVCSLLQHRSWYFTHAPVEGNTFKSTQSGLDGC